MSERAPARAGVHSRAAVAGIALTVLAVIGCVVALTIAGSGDPADRQTESERNADDVVRMLLESGVPVESPLLIYFDFERETPSAITLFHGPLGEGVFWLSVAESRDDRRRDRELLLGMFDQGQIVGCGRGLAATDQAEHLERIESVIEAAFGPCR
jgi:hypothetical protein